MSSRWIGNAALGLLLAGAMAGCEDNGPLTPSVLFVRGSVTGPGGIEVAAAQVLIVVTRVGDSVRTGQEPTQTDATGRYGALLGILEPPFDALLDVHVTPPDTTVLRPGSVLGRAARFNMLEERDTIRVDVVLEPA